MGRKSIWEKAELRDMHTNILSLLEDSEARDIKEIAELLVSKYPEMPEVQKWNGNVGNVARYVVARYLTFLKNRKYVERNAAGKWALIRKDTLRNEVIRGKALEWGLSFEEAAYRLLDEYLRKDEDKWQEYVKQLEEYERIERKRKAELEEKRRKLTEVSPV